MTDDEKKDVNQRISVGLWGAEAVCFFVSQQKLISNYISYHISTYILLCN